MMSICKSTRIVLLITGACMALLSFRQVNFFDITKNLDIFISLYKELNTYYVDTLQPDKLIKAGATAMLDDLDPYTDFIPEEDMDEYRIQTTGKYGGIGAIIGTRGEWVTITEPYEGCPAAKAGLRAGDKIIEVNGKSTRNQKTDEVSSMLKGKPGTTVQVKIRRLTADGSEQDMTVTLTREEIKIKNVPYYGIIEEGIGYIRLINFTDRAGAEVRMALQQMQSKAKLKGVILDVRGNPGGLLHEAIHVANVFVDRNVEIVSTKGKMSEWDKTFFTTQDPVDTKVPLVVLADGGSASASEIVSGALQDLDRAVIIGQKTYGKGLVQSTRSLPYGAKLKITTAKYYIPSGRCIQAINYAERNEDGSVKHIPDSLKNAFKTRNGRTVYDGGGIDPDIVTEPEKLANITASLVSKGLLFDYANLFRARHESIPDAASFALTEEEYDAFVQWLAGKEYDYTTESEKMLEELKAASEKEKYYESLRTELESLKKNMSHDKLNDLKKAKSQIKSMLEEEIASRYYLSSGRIANSIRSDGDIRKAVEILRDEQQMKKILAKK